MRRYLVGDVAFFSLQMHELRAQTLGANQGAGEARCVSSSRGGIDHPRRQLPVLSPAPEAVVLKTISLTHG